MKKKYEIDKQLRILRLMKMPKSLFRIWISNQVLRLLYTLQRPHKGVIQKRFLVKARDGKLIMLTSLLLNRKLLI